MPIREHLGYTLKNYDPCFNFNADRFCCSKRGAHFRENILQSECPLTKSNSYSEAAYYDKNDSRPLWLRDTGLVDPNPYTFTPQERAHTWCGRMPCSFETNKVPCQANMPVCTKSAGCASGSVQNQCSQ